MLCSPEKPGETSLDRQIAEAVLGWRDERDQWLDRGDEPTGYFRDLPQWWLVMDPVWRRRLATPPRLWRPTSDRACWLWLTRRLRINGFSVALLGDEEGRVEAAQVRRPNGTLVEIWEPGLSHGESLCMAALTALGIAPH